MDSRKATGHALVILSLGMLLRIGFLVNRSKRANRIVAEVDSVDVETGASTWLILQALLATFVGLVGGAKQAPRLRPLQASSDALVGADVVVRHSAKVSPQATKKRNAAVPDAPAVVLWNKEAAYPDFVPPCTSGAAIGRVVFKDVPPPNKHF